MGISATNRLLVRTLRTATVVAAVLGVAGATALLLGGHWDFMWSRFAIHMGLWPVLVALLVWWVSSRQPRNRAVWILALSAITGAYVAGLAVASVIIEGDPAVLLAQRMVPAELPAAAAWVLMFTMPTVSLGFFAFLTLGLLLFPDGNLPSPRWRGVALFALLAVAIGVVGDFLAYRPENLTNGGWLQAAGRVVFAIAVVLCLGALIGRFRSSSGPARQQFKWIAWGAAIFAPVVAVNSVVAHSRYEDLIRPVSLVAGIAMLVSYGVAVAKYRLYDVDVVISRTFVYGTLALFITGAYVAVVVGLGRLFGGGDGSNVVLGIIATVVIAIAFQPLRRRLQHVANRMVYGRRATPYEVLSTFSQRVAAVDPDVLTEIARAVAEGTTATSASIWMSRDDGLMLTARWPEDDAEPLDGVLSMDHASPVVHNGEQLGVVGLTLPAGQPFSAADARLVDQVAAGLGLALRNLRLTEDLRSRVQQLRDSRRRVVAVQDRTRRGLERDLHDGAQQRLVALKIHLGLVSSLAEKRDLPVVGRVITELAADTDETIDSIRDFARGIYPPLLEAEGLEAALDARTAKVPVPVSLQAAGVGRHPRELEATTYFCVLEAIRNAVKHASPGSIQVSIREQDGNLWFEVRDDGAGFDPNQATGAGLTIMADRLDAVGGKFAVDSRPGAGTVVSGAMPTRQLVSS